MNLEQLGIMCLAEIKNASYFPYKSGRLRDLATSGTMFTDTCYRIKFNSAIAPYVEYLEEGTRPHDIPRAFGKPLPFGIGGRFDGKFHPGSMKHKGFIKDKAVPAIVDFICVRYKGKAVVI